MAITVYRGEADNTHFEDLMKWADNTVYRWWKKHNNEVPNFWIAGGAPLDILSGCEPKDIDLWFPDEDSFDAVAEALSNSGATLIKSTASSSTYEVDENGTLPEYKMFPNGTYELVRRYFDSADDTVDFFDFIVSGIAVGNDFVCYHEKFFEHFAMKRLGINSTKYPTNTLRRIPKYVNKGFIPTDQDLERLAEALSGVDMDDENQNIFKRIEKNEDAYGNLPISTQRNRETKNARAYQQVTGQMSTAPTMKVPPIKRDPSNTGTGFFGKKKKTIPWSDGYF